MACEVRGLKCAGRDETRWTSTTGKLADRPRTLYSSCTFLPALQRQVKRAVEYILRWGRRDEFYKRVARVWGESGRVLGKWGSVDEYGVSF